MNISKEPNLLNQKIIFDITKFTTTDFANHLSCIVWFAKCNMQCLYCYNEHIVNAKSGHMTLQELLDFLAQREGLLDGVVLSGGEATLQNLVFICKSIKKMKYKIKLDTNGLNTKLLHKLLNKELIDYVALDYKAPRYKFEEITQSSQYHLFEESLHSLLQSGIDFEVRTTIHSDLLNHHDINFMINHLHSLGYNRPYYLQHFLATDNNIGGLKMSEIIFDESQIEQDKLQVVYRN